MSAVPSTAPLQGQVALVTGATAFIGRAVALKLASQGAHVVVNGRNAEAGARVVAEIQQHGGEARFEAADLAEPGALRDLADRAASALGRIDILVASGAGASADSPPFRLFMDLSPEELEASIRGHWLTRLHAIRAVVPHMAKLGRGKIVAIGTDAGRVATVGESVIGGATGAMMQMCRALARELGRNGVRINVVSMSYVSDAEPRWSQGSQALMPKDGSGMLQALKKRMLFDVTCNDVAEAAAFFASPASDAITGQVLSVNGGLSTPG